VKKNVFLMPNLVGYLAPNARHQVAQWPIEPLNWLIPASSLSSPIRDGQSISSFCLFRSNTPKRDD
jgi:hypothetical protein